jgi:hypothetical protein
MTFKNFDDIGDSEPRAWGGSSMGTKLGKDEDDDDEIPVPYCDEFEEEFESEEEDEDEPVTENDTETDTESVGSLKLKNPLKRNNKSTAAAFTVVLQEEVDFMEE